MADVLAAMEAFGTHCRRGIHFAREAPVGDAATLPHDAARAFGRAALGGERLEDLVRFLAVACDFEAVLEARLECVASIAVEYGREALLHLHRGLVFGGSAARRRKCVATTSERRHGRIFCTFKMLGVEGGGEEDRTFGPVGCWHASREIYRTVSEATRLSTLLSTPRVPLPRAAVAPSYLVGPCRRRRCSSCARRRCSPRTVTIFDSDATLRCSVLPQP